MKLTLPHSPDREALVGFWATMSGLTGIAFGTGVWLGSGAGVTIALVLAVAAAGAVFVAGMRRERRLVSRIYDRWNRMARAYGRRARGAVTTIWFWAVFTPMAWSGEKSRLAVGGARWARRGTLSPEGYGDLGTDGTPVDREGGLEDFARWTVRSGRSWGLCLIPLLWSLRVLDTRKARVAPSSDVYTLY